jgi:hypothetical protein
MWLTKILDFHKHYLMIENNREKAEVLTDIYKTLSENQYASEELFLNAGQRSAYDQSLLEGKINLERRPHLAWPFGAGG